MKNSPGSLNPESLKILKQSIQDLLEANKWLQRSFKKCSTIGMKENYSPDEFDDFENLTSRFGRTCDLLINKVYRAIDKVEMEDAKTIIDVINKAHKRNLIDSPQEVRLIKELRNLISHEYANAELKEIFQTVFKQVPKLSALVVKAQEYCQKHSYI